LVVNKWDAIEKDHRSAKAFKDAIHSVFEFAKYAPVLFVSALQGTRCPKILEKAVDVFESCTKRIKTSDLNRIVSRAFQATPPPPYHGEPVKVYFSTQVGNSPPTIVIFVNHPNRLGGSYQRYLKGTIRKHFEFEGCDIRILVRKRTEKAAGRTQTKVEFSEAAGHYDQIAKLVTDAGEEVPVPEASAFDDELPPEEITPSGTRVSKGRKKVGGARR
jgi:hypothetical protein